jgi:hypothetical protein
MRFTSESSPRLCSRILGCGWQVADFQGGRNHPRWRGDGNELFYVASDSKLMSVEISAKPVFEAGAPRPLFQLPPGFIGGEVTADGRRFLIGVPVALSASRTLYGGAELADDLEEISPANLQARIDVGS